jgi:hypothetical protein
MQIIKNRAMRIILRCHRRNNVRTMLDNLGWQSKKQRIYMNTLVFIFKIKHNMAPDLASKLLYTWEATTRCIFPKGCKKVRREFEHISWFLRNAKFCLISIAQASTSRSFHNIYVESSYCSTLTKFIEFSVIEMTYQNLY